MDRTSISKASRRTDTGDYHCSFEQLLEEPFPDGHPVTKICEEALNKLLNMILNTNAAIYASKITNLFSRLGGTYKTHKVEGSKAKETIAYMPIYGTLRSKEQSSKIARLVHGICVRGPQHARSPTDKIPIALIELVENTPENSTMVAFMSKAVVHVCGEMLVVMRQNSIMKEDPCYQGFIMNALFCVANNLGYMTLECPSIRPDIDMTFFIEETLGECDVYYKDRFIDGILFATIGNSRDEGYFACLRKLFMIMYSWRQDARVGCLDIESFCKKTNDCLIDNPLSMYYHKYVLKVMEVYKKRQEAGAQET